MQRVLGAHDEVTRRWFEYETDLTKLIDFPMMTDMREPLTVDFHRAKVAADALRPDDPAELRQPAVYSEFRDAVHAERVAFDVAEREATRRRRSDFSEAEQDSLARARKLINVAVDSAATPAAERQGAYRRALHLSSTASSRAAGGECRDGTPDRRRPGGGRSGAACIAPAIRLERRPKHSAPGDRKRPTRTGPSSEVWPCAVPQPPSAPVVGSSYCNPLEPRRRRDPLGGDLAVDGGALPGRPSDGRDDRLDVADRLVGAELRTGHPRDRFLHQRSAEVVGAAAEHRPGCRRRRA